MPQPVARFRHTGLRSLQVVAFAQRQGFETVYNLAGGMSGRSREADAGVPSD
jgi:rhodanese-related sulfurtransferase